MISKATKAFSYIALCLVLAFGISTIPFVGAQAEPPAEDPEAVLNDAQAKLDQISSEYDALSLEISELQKQIDELAEQVLAAQQAMIDGREALGSTVLYEYRGGAVSAMLSVLMGSADITELTRNMNYMNQIMDHQAEEVLLQKDLKEQFTKVSNELSAQKDTQDEKLQELATKREEATNIVEQASAKVEENNARIEQMRKQADQFIWGGVQEEEPPSDGGNASNGTSGGGGGSQTAPSDMSGFRTVVSSAYGGSTDASTGAVATTATGAICDDGSLGIAIPMSWSNPWQNYYNKTVEIVYNGRLVYATINDCGNMHLYGCEIDLQPGVWKALDPSCTSCAQWGHRSVQYRIL